MTLKNIAIVGAGGQMGAHIVQALLEKGHFNITALTRKGSENKIPKGLRSVAIDYDDHASLVKGLEGQDALIITLSILAPHDTTEKLAKACAEAHVQWILPNEWGSNAGHSPAVNAMFPQKAKDQKIINDLGLSWIGIACGFWYEFSLGGTTDRYGFDFNDKTVVFYDEGDRAICTSTWTKTALGTANLLSLPISAADGSACISDYRNKFANISSFKVSQKDMFASVLRVSGDKASDWKISYEPLEQRLAESRARLATGDMSAYVRMLYATGFLPDVLDFDKAGGVANDALGLPEEDFDAATKYGMDIGTSNYMEQRYAHLMKPKVSSGQGQA